MMFFKKHSHRHMLYYTHTNKSNTFNFSSTKRLYIQSFTFPMFHILYSNTIFLSDCSFITTIDSINNRAKFDYKSKIIVGNLRKQNTMIVNNGIINSVF